MVNEQSRKLGPELDLRSGIAANDRAHMRL